MDAIRPARAGDADTLKEIWKTVFGDTDEFIDAFFRHYGTDTAFVAPVSADLAAAGYLLPYGSIAMPGGFRHSCSMIYSVAVMPQYRSLGLGGELTRALINTGHAAGYGAVVLHPASNGLFGYYSERTLMREWFCAFEREYVPERKHSGGKLTRLTAEEYAGLRSGLLSECAHIEPDFRALSFQDDICKLTGGGLYRITTPDGGDACAIVELNDSAVNVKELLAPGGAESAMSVIADAFPAGSYSVRTPVSSADGASAHRFGMLAADPELAAYFELRSGAWFGPAFD